jgi:hypothetical protein
LTGAARDGRSSDRNLRAEGDKKILERRMKEKIKEG